MVVMQFLLPLMLILSPVFAQQISNGGLFRVPADERYRDPKTRAAIFKVSRFATAFQPLQDMRAERNRLVEESRMSVSRSFKAFPYPLQWTHCITNKLETSIRPKKTDCGFSSTGAALKAWVEKAS